MTLEDLANILRAIAALTTITRNTITRTKETR